MGVVLVTAIAATSIIYATYISSRFDEPLKSRPERYRTFWPRFCAGWIDLLVIFPITYGMGALMEHVGPGVTATVSDILCLVVVYGYEVILHWKYGKTVGKMVMRVTVLRNSDESRISFRQSVMRVSIPLGLETAMWVVGVFYLLNGHITDPHRTFIGESVIWLTLGWYLAEFVTMLANAKRRAIHDIIAGTVVVRDV